MVVNNTNDSINVVSNQYGSPTHAKDLVEAIINITEQFYNDTSKIRSKLYHYANSGPVSKYDFAKKVIEYAKIDCKLDPVDHGYFKLPAKRPINSVLESSNIAKDFDLSIRSWDISLKECMERILSDEQ